jgi:hypothetical protein
VLDGEVFKICNVFVPPQQYFYYTVMNVVLFIFKSNAVISKHSNAVVASPTAIEMNGDDIMIASLHCVISAVRAAWCE